TSVNAWVSEVLVYDSGSTDKTVEIAKSLGASVVSGPWLGFGPTKKQAAQTAKNQWILAVDSDEEVSLDLQNEIKAKFNNLQSETAYRLPRLSYFLNRWIRHGGWYPDYQTRLFNKNFSNWNSKDIHEKVEAKHYDSFSSCLNHYVFRDIEHQVQTNNKYSSLQAAEMKKNRKSFSWFHFFTKPYVKFIECYFWKLGFLDGWAGFVIARSAAYSVFLKWSKLYELENLK
ncbi:MAG: glycosyltransferase family 2 protein, partial [Pseudobdellovibrio sp.]